MNDGPKAISFFQVPETQPGSARRSARIATQTSAMNIAPSKVLSALMKAPDEYNAELDTLLSCLESKAPPDLCLLSTPRTSALHATFPGDLNGRDPKSQREIDQLPPEEAKRYNDATLAEFNGMKKKQVMELIPSSRLPHGMKAYPSVVNWTTKKVLGVYSKTKWPQIRQDIHRLLRSHSKLYHRAHDSMHWDYVWLEVQQLRLFTSIPQCRHR
jgi:hypothetical protein